MKGKLQRSSRESRWSMRSTLLGGTRTKIHDRKGWVVSSERPHGRDEISSCHRRKPIAEWFKEQFEKLKQNIRRPIQPQRKSKGI